MLWAFKISLVEKLPNTDDEAVFQAELYKNIDPENAKEIIAANHRPNRAMYDIITLVNRMPVIFLRRDDIDKDIMTFEDTFIGCDRLFYSPVTLIYTRHNSHFLTAWQLLLTFGLYNYFQKYWNHVAMILSVVVISILLSGIKELAVQLE